MDRRLNLAAGVALAVMLAFGVAGPAHSADPRTGGDGHGGMQSGASAPMPASAPASPRMSTLGPAPAPCDGPPLTCADRATPLFTPDGTLWLAASGRGQVWVLASDDAGRSFRLTTEVTREAERLDTSSDSRPQLAFIPSGRSSPPRLVVGYAVMTDKPFTGEIRIAQSVDGGRSFSPPRLLAGHGAGQRFLSLGTDPAGRVFAAWIDKRNLETARATDQPYSGAGLAVAWAGADGEFSDSAVIQDHTCECCRVAVGFAGAGRPVIAWRNLFGPARDHAVLTYAGPDEPGPVRRVSDDDWQIAACPHHGPALSVASDGSYHVAWFTASARREGLFYARSVDQGRVFTSPLGFGNPARQPARPQVLATSDGVWLVWQEFDGSHTRVMGRNSRDAGRTWAADRVLLSTAGAADQPRLVADAEGEARLSWLTRLEGLRIIPLEGRGR